MKARQWRQVAEPMVWDLAAVLEEYRSLQFAPQDLGDLYRAFWAAVERRDPKALRAACRAIQAEARRRWLARQEVA